MAKVEFEPDLLYEDATHMMSFYFNTNDFFYVIRTLNGYISLLPNILAWLFVQLPPIWTPYLIKWAAIIIYSLAVFSFCLPHFRHIVEKDTYRIIIVLIFCLYPFGKGLMISNLNYSLWNLLYLFILWSLADISATNKKFKWAIFLGMTLCAFSHPLTVTSMPLLILLAFRGKIENRVFRIYLIVLLTVYFFRHTATQSVSNYILSIPHGVQLSMQRVGFELLAGTQARQFLFENGLSWIIYSVGSIILIGPLIISRIRKLPFSIFCKVAYLLSIAILFVIISNTRMTFEQSISDPWVQRFFHTSRMLVALSYGIAVFHDRHLYVSRYKDMTWAMIMIVYLALLNHSNRFLFQTYTPAHQAIMAVVSDADIALRKAQLGQPYTRIHRGGIIKDWPVYLDIDCHLHIKKTRDCFYEEQRRLKPIGLVSMPFERELQR
jgi:hypothetical protein